MRGSRGARPITVRDPNENPPAHRGTPGTASARNVRENRIDARKIERVSRDFFENYPRCHIFTGTVLVVQSGHIGTACTVPPHLDGSGCHALIIVRPVPGTLDGDFLAYYLNSPTGRRRLSDIHVGSTVKHINTTD